MKPDNKIASIYLFAAGVAGQVGCLLTVVIGGAVVLGLVLDRALNTKPLFIFLLLLGSIPLNLWAVYRYTKYKTKSVETPAQKEDVIRDDQLES